MMVVLSIFAFSTSALAEKKNVSLFSGYEAISDWVYVDKGNTLHVGVNNSAENSSQWLTFQVVDTNGKIVTSGGTNDANDDKAYAIGVPVGKYKLVLRCDTNGALPTCQGNGWIND